ncbi:ribosomal protein L7/L12 [Alphaproteobacteria bacterium endosymbiont of Tiliacea citrago]|uniref:ribosomal protein L7/L12 n=1 Tax=Alphaproteobacteria bacterium endosymbiont of Tiliacea citrago TaxID=3077944 RepID=UPI00313ADD20
MSVSNKIDDIIKGLEGLTIAETVEFVKECEDRWGVSAAAATVAVAGPAAVAEEEDSEKEVLLTAMGEKIKTIKALREVNPDLSLMDAKKAVEAITDAAPYSLGKFEKTKAEELLKKFQEVGAAPKIK